MHTITQVNEQSLTKHNILKTTHDLTQKNYGQAAKVDQNQCIWVSLWRALNLKEKKVLSLFCLQTSVTKYKSRVVICCTILPTWTPLVNADMNGYECCEKWMADLE